MIKKYQKDITTLLIAGSLYLINNLFIKKLTSGNIQYFFICYFNDILAPLVILPYCNILFEYVNIKLIDFKYIIIFILICGFVWEFLAPFIKENSFCDLFDFIAYITGAAIYWIIQKINIRKV